MLFIFLIINLNKVDSAPYRLGPNNNEDRVRNNFHPADYVRDSDLDHVISYLPSTYYTGNFVSDDIPLEELLSIIEHSNEDVATTATTTTEKSHEPDEITTETTLVDISTSNSVIGEHDSSDTTTDTVSLSDQERPTVAPADPPATTVKTIVEECPICYEPLDSTPQCRTTCGHNFHRACLHKWVQHVSNLKTEK